MTNKIEREARELLAEAYIAEPKVKNVYAEMLLGGGNLMAMEKAALRAIEKALTRHPLRSGEGVERDAVVEECAKVADAYAANAYRWMGSYRSAFEKVARAIRDLSTSSSGVSSDGME